MVESLSRFLFMVIVCAFTTGKLKSILKLFLKPKSGEYNILEGMYVYICSVVLPILNKELEPSCDRHCSVPQ